MKFFLYVIALVLLVFLSFLWYIGVFSSVKVEEKLEGGYVIAGIDFVGSYSKTGPEFEKVDKIIKDMGIECTKGLGIYFDNPEKVEAEKCRSFISNVIEEKDLDKIDILKEKGLKIDTIAKCNSLVVEIPIRCSFSYMVGPMKAYPAISKHIGDKECKDALVYELYDMPAHKAYYIMQCNKE